MSYLERSSIEAANCVDIISVLQMSGENVKRVGQYYETETHDSLRIKENWYFWNSKGTYGHTIDFVKEYYNLNFVDATEYILNNNNFNFSRPKTQTKQASFLIADLNEVKDINLAIAYLCKRRHINYNIIEEFVKKNVISQDNKGNVIFKILDENNRIIGAEKRGTYSGSHFKQVTKGSKRGYGVNISVGKPEKAFFFEGSIDLISFYELYKSELANSILVSMSGLKDTVITSTLARSNIDYKNTYLCVDNDQAGTKFVEKLKLQHPEVKHFKHFEDVKDWNEYLICKNLHYTK